MKAVTIYEVGPRDGLQNEADFVPTDKKYELINLLSATGITKIESASFVSPKWVPQMADAEAVMSGVARKTAITYAALTPKLRDYFCCGF